MTDTDAATVAARAVAPPPGSLARRRLMRLGGAFLVGSVAAPGFGLAVVAFAFGGFAVALTAFGVALTVGALLLAVVHRATPLDVQRPALASSFGWGLGVLIASIVLIGGFAIWWQLADLQFGSSPTQWWLLSGVGVALVAALCTRGTAVPGFVVLVALAVGLFFVAGVPAALRSGAGDGEDEVAPSGLSRALIYVVSEDGYTDGQITTDSPGSTILYDPMDAPADLSGPDRTVRLTGQAPAPADCGRVENLPFDNHDRATCEVLAPGIFHRSTRRYHEVVVVRPTVVVTAMGSKHVSLNELRAAATTARQATDAEAERLYKGWVLEP